MGRPRNLELTANIIKKASVGETKKGIAEDLGITEKTVHNHLQSIKSDIDSRIEKGEDPWEAWEAVLAGILIGAGVATASIALMKVLEDLRKGMEEVKQYRYPSLEREIRHPS